MTNTYISTLFTLLLVSNSFKVFSQNKTLVLPYNVFSDSLKKQKTPQLIDIRGQKDYSLGHIKKSTHLDLNNANFEDYLEKTFDKKRTLFVYCQSGDASSAAAEYLTEIGFDNLIILEGGFERWIAKSNPYSSSKSDFTPLAFLTEEVFLKQTKSNKYVLVDFYADWCKPCKKMSPILLKLDNDLAPLTLVKIDAEKNTTLAQKFEVIEIPTLLLFKNGKQIWKHTGEITEKELLEVIN